MKEFVPCGCLTDGRNWLKVCDEHNSLYRNLKGSAKAQECLQWLEDNCTLHKSVEILYVVDGYEVQVMHEDGVTELSPRFHGETLASAIGKAIKAKPD